MSISLYFGLPRCGKTTMLAKIAYEETKRICKGKSKYECVYSNVPLSLPDDQMQHFKVIKFSWLGKYDICRSLVLIDEASLMCDNRDYKSFAQESKEFFLLHGHYQDDVIFFNQAWDALDKKIRVITDRVFYIYKLPILGRWYSKCYRVPYGIIIPDPKKDDNQKLGEIIQGYCKPSLFERIFLCQRLWRRRYYRYFDSWDRPDLPPIPTEEAV